MGRFVGDERINYQLSHLVFYLFAQKNAVGKKKLKLYSRYNNTRICILLMIHGPISDGSHGAHGVSGVPWSLMSPSLRSGGLVGRHHDAYTRWYIDEALCNKALTLHATMWYVQAHTFDFCSI